MIIFSIEIYTLKKMAAFIKLLLNFLRIKNVSGEKKEVTYINASKKPDTQSNSELIIQTLDAKGNYLQTIFVYGTEIVIQFIYYIYYIYKMQLGISFRRL